MLQLLQLKAAPKWPPIAICIPPNLDRHLLDCSEDAVTLEDSNSSGVVLPSVLLLLIVCATKEREHLRRDGGSLSLVPTKEMRDAESIVACDVA